MSRFTTLNIVREGAVDWVSLSRPDRLNAINSVMITELHEYFSHLRNDLSCRVVVLRGAGRGFCAGLDLHEVEAVKTLGKDRPNITLRSIVGLMRACPQPIIALLHGAVCGGGLVFALAADIRLAVVGAQMKLAFTDLGLSGCELGTSYFLPRLVGHSVARELMMTGRPLSAERALAVSLVSEICSEDMIEVSARTLISDMLQLTPIGLRKTKEVLDIASNMNDLGAVMVLEEQTQRLCMQDADYQSRVAAFGRRRKRSNVPIEEQK